MRNPGHNLRAGVAHARTQAGTPAEASVFGAEHSFSIEDVLGVVWRRLWVILLTTIVFIGAAVGVGLTQEPTYKASVQLIVGQQNPSDYSNLTGDVSGLQQIGQTIAAGVGSHSIAEAVIEQLNVSVSPQTFQESISAEPVTDTQYVVITYVDTNPVRAQKIANATGEIFSEKIAEISPRASGVTATLWDPATVPTAPAGPNLLLYALMALFLGAMLGVGVAFLLEHFDDSWSSVEEVEQISGVPTFGVVPPYEVPKNKKGR